MRILFEMAERGYLRMYGSTVRCLADRGHTVIVAYDTPEKRGLAGAEIEAAARLEIAPPPPRRTGRTATIAAGTRLTADYVRYLDPRFAPTPYLRRRMDKFLPKSLSRLTRVRGGSPLARVVVRLLLAVERLLPTDRALDSYLEAHGADVIVVTPGIARGQSTVRQTDTVKSARRLGIPVAIAVSSWDHLTTKGLIKVLPDRLFVWNETQRREATELHRVPANLIELTGAQLFDHWFTMEPDLTREEFTGQLGLRAENPYLLYVGSSPNITEPRREEDFVRRWIGAFRASQGSLKDVGILVRPHPGNVGHWATVDLADLGAVVAPRERPTMPMSAADERLYFHSLYFAAGVVGINTSAIIESSVLHRPVFTVRDAAFRETQDGTFHFHYLLAENGGCLYSASTMAQHIEQVAAVIADPERQAETIDRFLQAFVRPHGLDRSATPILADAIEVLGTSG